MYAVKINKIWNIGNSRPTLWKDIFVLLCFMVSFLYDQLLAKVLIKLCPGAVEASHQQFALKPDDPNNPTITKAYATNYARVWHVCFCFMLLVALINSSSLVPVDMARGLHNDDPKLDQKSMSNKLKKKSYKLINKKVKYNMMLLHKASM